MNGGWIPFSRFSPGVVSAVSLSQLAGTLEQSGAIMKSICNTCAFFPPQWHTEMCAVKIPSLYQSDTGNCYLIQFSFRL